MNQFIFRMERASGSSCHTGHNHLILTPVPYPAHPLSNLPGNLDQSANAALTTQQLRLGNPKDHCVSRVSSDASSLHRGCSQMPYSVTPQHTHTPWFSADEPEVNLESALKEACLCNRPRIKIFQFSQKNTPKTLALAQRKKVESTL